MENRDEKGIKLRGSLTPHQSCIPHRVFLESFSCCHLVFCRKTVFSPFIPNWLLKFLFTQAIWKAILSHLTAEMFYSMNSES